MGQLDRWRMLRAVLRPRPLLYSRGVIYVYNTQSVLRGRDRLIVGLTASYGTIKVVKNVREYRRGNHELTIQRNWQYKLLKTKKNKNTTQHNICWKPLCTNKHKWRKQNMSPPTNNWMWLCFHHVFWFPPLIKVTSRI
jgi:hypothetical protein